VKRREFMAGAIAAAAVAPTAVGKEQYRVIACEEAFTIPEIQAELRKLRGEDETQPVPPHVRAMLDVDAGRLRAMDAAGVDMHVLSLGTPGVQDFAPATAVSLATVVNDRLAEIARSHPNRFAGLATFAPQRPQAAARELERAVKTLGLRGALFNSHTNNEYFDDPKFWAIFEAAEALNIPLYLHPRDPSSKLGGPALNIPGFRVGWTFGVEAASHALRMIAGGVFDRFPRLQIILGHLGETLPFIVSRLDERYRVESAGWTDRKLQRLPSEYLRGNFYFTTSGMNVWPPLRTTIETVGIERVLFAIDYPFEDQTQAVMGIEATPLTSSDKRRIFEHNARRVFGLT
jgi:2,3-dihydroxybenzoate decarboxylase